MNRTISVLICGYLIVLQHINLIAQVTPTKEWVSYYSSDTYLNGELVTAGSIITAYDPDGHLCGIDTVSISGHYGFLQVYGDDPTTSNIDEGAEQGDSLYVSINGYFTQSLFGIVPLWTGNGERIELDLEAWSNWPPLITDIPDQTIQEGEEFLPFILDGFVSDPDHSEQELIWTFSGNEELSLQITDKIVSVICPEENWFGSETVVFRVSDPEGLFAEDSVRFTVIAVNDTPVIRDIEDRIISEGEQFAAINLNEYVTDLDQSDEELTWTYAGNHYLSMSILGGILSITCPNEDWFGLDSVIVKVTDPAGAFDSDVIRFRVIAVNDTPIVADIEDQLILEGESFQPIVLDDYVYDVDDLDSQISWIASGNQNLIISINNRIAEITVPDTDWTGCETIIFIASDRAQVSVTETATFTVQNLNDGPVISHLPILRFREDNSLKVNYSFWYEFIEDPDHEDSLLTFLIEPGQNVHVQAYAESILFWADEDWFGRDTLPIVVTDGYLTDSSHLHIHVSPVNDRPIIKLPDSIVFMDDTNSQMNLWDYVEDADSHDSLLLYEFICKNDSITWLYTHNSGQLEIIPEITFTGSTSFKITVIDDSGATAVDSVVVKVIKTTTEVSDLSTRAPITQFKLKQNYPNPFNPVTIINYELPTTINVELSIYNMLGEKVVTLDSGNKSAGNHQVEWDAGHLAGGVYYYMLKAGSFRDVKKMILLR